MITIKEGHWSTLLSDTHCPEDADCSYLAYSQDGQVFEFFDKLEVAEEYCRVMETSG